MGIRANPLRILHIILILMPFAAQSGTVLTGTLGADSRNHFQGAHFGYSAAFYAKFDDMTLLGVQSGQGTPSSSQAIPVFASTIIRLPIGRVVLPVATGDIGYAIDDHHSGLIWRAGGGFDIRNGRHSSFLLLGAYERQGSLVGWSGRGGLLLEFFVFSSPQSSANFPLRGLRSPWSSGARPRDAPPTSAAPLPTHTIAPHSFPS